MIYDAAFYEEEGPVARRSAEIVLPWLFGRHPDVETVVDVGCGTGSWAATAATLGRVAVGVDWGVPVELQDCVYIDRDLVGGYLCDGYDLAICLEVAEHLPESSAEPLVAGLTAAGLVLFSAATPGQPGVGHVNCQPHDYWHDLFASHGYLPTFVGGEFAEPVADFYRSNLFLYAWQP